MMKGRPGSGARIGFLAAVLAALLSAGCRGPTVEPSPLRQPPATASAAPQTPAVPVLSEPTPRPQLIPEANGQDGLGPGTVVFNTEAGVIKVRHVGYDSLLLQLGSTLIHLNPWGGAADYGSLPRADQIWITDPAPEHLDLRTIRLAAQESTRLIVDPETARLIHGLLPYFLLRTGVAVGADGLQVQAVPAYSPGPPGGGPRLRPSNAYLASFGDLRILLAARPGLLPDLETVAPIDLLVIIADDTSGLPLEQTAEIVAALDARVLLPYAYDPDSLTQLADLLADTEVALLPLEGPDESHAHGPRRPGLGELASLDWLTQDPDQLLEQPAGLAAGPILLLPDLQTLPPSDLRLVYNSYSQTTMLRLTNSVVNVGDGPLEMWGGEPAQEGVHQVRQRIYDNQQGFIEIEVGEFVFHPHHAHWHVDGFSLYELWSLRPDGTLDDVVATSGKVGFCLRDNYRFPHPQQARRAAYGSCGTTRQGISVGWVDAYPYYLAGQTIDVTEVPEGTYALLSTADPFNWMLESEESNNFALVYLRIWNGRVTVLDRAGAQAALAEPSD